MNVVGFLRSAFPLVVGGVLLWLVLAGVFALSLFVILPLLLIFAAIGAFFYWRYGRMLTSASEGEIGQAVQDIDMDQTGVVQFNRQMNAGNVNYPTAINVACVARTPVRMGESVCVERVDGKTIFVKRMGE